MSVATARSPRPNILYILTDQLRHDCLGCNGNAEVHTPNLDRLAADGCNLTNCVSSAPVCSPHRACLQTGRHIHQHGVGTNEAVLDPTAQRCLADYFNEAGYATCFIGKSHWSGHHQPADERDPQALRWQRFVPPPGDRFMGVPGHPGRYEPAVQLDTALSFIDEQGDRPWLVQLNWHPPHVDGIAVDASTCERMRRRCAARHLGLDDSVFTPTGMHTIVPHALDHPVVPPRWAAFYDDRCLTPLPGSRDRWSDTLIQWHLRTYYGAISALDELVGIILDRFATPAGRETIVVFTADHGDFQGTVDAVQRAYMGKTWPFLCALRVPMLAWSNGGTIRPGGCGNGLMGSVDQLPTLLDIAGLAADPDLPGQSQAAWLRDGHGPRQEALLLGCDYYHWRGLLTDSHLLAYAHAAPDQPQWILRDLADRHPDACDHAGAPEYAGVLQRLRGQLIDRLHREGDHTYLKRHFP